MEVSKMGDDDWDNDGYGDFEDPDDTEEEEEE
jgi:hypothetical protein